MLTTHDPRVTGQRGSELGAARRLFMRFGYPPVLGDRGSRGALLAVL